MADPLIVIDSSAIREGKLTELKARVAEFVEFVAANEAEIIAYSAYLDDAGTRDAREGAAPRECSRRRKRARVRIYSA